MSDVLPALLAIILFVITLTTVSSAVLSSADDVRQAMVVQEARSLPQINTEINTSSGRISLQASSTIELTLLNRGNTTLADFSDWDVIAEIRQATTTAITYLSYTTSTSPSANEWTLLDIYNNASSTPRIVETFSLGMLDPGESMVALLNPFPPVMSGTYDRVTFVTPSGITAKVIFEIQPILLYVVDATDAVVYIYNSFDDTLYDSQTLDGENSNAKGITKETGGFWTTDYIDDLMYEYTPSFSLTSTWTQEAANQRGAGITTNGTYIWTADDTDPNVNKYNMNGIFISKFGQTTQNRDSSGVTTDGTNIWTVDEKDDTVYKYEKSGAFIDSFALTAANADAFGITTDGINIWVVDVIDTAVYKYDMAGTFVSSFNLTAANADPQGITHTVLASGPEIYYLHNNPTPPTGNTIAQSVLTTDTTKPTATTLYNYDTDRDLFAGLAVTKGGVGPSEPVAEKTQVWRSGALAESLVIDGSATADLWSAMQDFGQGQAGVVTMYLRDYNGVSYTEIGNGTLTLGDWQGGSSTWVKRTIIFTGLDYTISAGNELEITLVVGSSSGDDMWFAYDTASYPSTFNLP